MSPNPDPRPGRRALVLLVAALALPSGAGSAPLRESLHAELLASSRQRQYMAPDARELAQAGAWFRELFARPAAPPQALAQALDMEQVPVAPGLLLLRERTGAMRGRPAMIVRQEAPPLMVQIPHAFHDEMTREIGLDLFLASGARIGVWNTVPRRFENRTGEAVDADMAHLPASWFNELTLAFARQYPLGRIVQLHGFAAGKRRAKSAGLAFIFSNGTRQATPALRDAARCLARNSGLAVGVYPETADELGGTTNAQVHTLAGQTVEFFHLEISRAARQQLRDDSALRQSLQQCLTPGRGPR